MFLCTDQSFRSDLEPILPQSVANSLFPPQTLLEPAENALKWFSGDWPSGSVHRQAICDDIFLGLTKGKFYPKERLILLNGWLRSRGLNSNEDPVKDAIRQVNTDGYDRLNSVTRYEKKAISKMEANHFLGLDFSPGERQSRPAFF